MNIFLIPEDVIELNRFFVIISLIIFFSALFLWPLGWVFRRPALTKENAAPLTYKPLFAVSRYLSIFMILMAFLVYFFLKNHTELIDTMSFPGIDKTTNAWQNILLSLPSLLSILFPLHVLLLVLVWTGLHGTRVFRIHYSLVSVAFLIFLIFLISWNLVVPGYYFSVLF